MPSNDQRYHGQGYEGGSGEGEQCFHHPNLFCTGWDAAPVPGAHLSTGRHEDLTHRSQDDDISASKH
jgi:hypothetical protein